MQYPEKEACRAASCEPGNCTLAKIVEQPDNEFNNKISNIIRSGAIYRMSGSACDVAPTR
jgi:hypothetical protein